MNDVSCTRSPRVSCVPSREGRTKFVKKERNVRLVERQDSSCCIPVHVHTTGIIRSFHVCLSASRVRRSDARGKDERIRTDGGRFDTFG